MSNNKTDTRTAGYHWWSRIIAIILAVLLALMWFFGYGPFRANCCGTSPAAAPVVAAPVAAAVAAAGAATLSFENGKVTIKGEVGTEAEKAKLLADAATTYGAGNVIDAVTVKAGLGALGIVTLIGQVPSEAKKLADGEAAVKLFAPVKVDNQLTVVMAKVDDNCALALKATVSFATGSAQLSAEGKKALDAMAGCLKNGGTVTGHTDNVGSPESNQVLSEKRAKSSAAYLVSKGAKVSDTKGAGETSPIADNASAEGRAKNRRMEITAQ